MPFRTQKFSPYIHARISPIIHAQKIPHHIPPYYYVCNCDKTIHYPNNPFFLFAYVLMFQRAYVTMSYVPMSQRNSHTMFPQMFFLCLVNQLLYSILSSSALHLFPCYLTSIRVNSSRFNSTGYFTL